METESLSSKLIGWYGTYRGRFLLLQSKVLSKEEFILYEASIAFSDWDKDHKNYGTLNLNQKEIEALLGFSAGFVCKYGKGLVEKGLWQELPNGLVRPLGIELIWVDVLKEQVKKYKIVNLQTYLAEQQTSIVASQQQVADKQTNAPKDKGLIYPEAIADLQSVPSKSDLISFKDDSFTLRSNEEYQRIWDEMGKPADFTPDDMRWIDQNIHEGPDSFNKAQKDNIPKLDF